MARSGRGLINVWPPLPPEAWLWSRPTRPPFPLDHPEARLYAFGRQALWNGILALGLAAGDEVLVPDYNHGSEVEALRVAGIEVRFYSPDEGLEPREEDLARLLGPRTRGLYVIDYNGFPQDAARWRRWCDERELLLIEDAAQAWLAERDGRPSGSMADLAFFCAYKTYGVPEGALLISRVAPEPLRLDPGRGIAPLTRRHGLWLAQRSAAFASLARRRAKAVEYDPVVDFAMRSHESLPWSTTDPLLRRLVAQDAAAARRANYRALLRDLAPFVPAPFQELPDGASPFFFPIRTTRKAQLLAELADRGIKALDVWSATHPAMQGIDATRAGQRRDTTIGLPVHQELGMAEIERIADAVSPRRVARPELRLEPIPDFDVIGSEWDELALRAGNLFATREWLATWWLHFGGGRELRLTACRDAAGELVAILPLYLSSSRPFRTLRFLGHGVGDRLGPICAVADTERVARALSSMLRRDGRGWDVVLAETLPADERWSALLRGTRLTFEQSPSLEVRWDGFDQFLASRSRNFREQVGRRERKLMRRHALRYRLCSDLATLERDMTTLFDMHDARWDGASDAFGPDQRAFHQQFAARALQRGWLRLWILELDGRAAAAWYGFRFANSEWYYQSGREPRLEREAVGFVLLSHTVRVAMDEKVAEYKLLRGNEEYKSRFANSDAGLETFVIGRGVVGRSGAVGAAAATALPANLRRHVARLAGR